MGALTGVDEVLLRDDRVDLEPVPSHVVLRAVLDAICEVVLAAGRGEDVVLVRAGLLEALHEVRRVCASDGGRQTTAWRDGWGRPLLHSHSPLT